MPLFVLTSVERSYSAGNAPSSFNIADAMRRAALSGVAQGGAWVGPAPRIVRRGGFTTNILHPFSSQNLTYATWVYELPEQSTARLDQLLTTLRGRVDANLAPLGDWTGATVSPFNPGLHGDLAFWNCADRRRCASVTQTQDAFPSLNDDAPENPYGPTDAASHPSTVTEQVDRLRREGERQAQVWTDVLWAATALTAAGLGVYSLKTYRDVRQGRAALAAP